MPRPSALDLRRDAFRDVTSALRCTTSRCDAAPCWMVWVSSCAISSWPPARLRLELVAAEEDVLADGEGVAR